MAVNISFASTNGGVAITSLNSGDVANGEDTVANQLYLSHDGANSITDVGIYVREYSGTYTGAATAAADLAELLNWGDTSTLEGFGGLHFNFLATTTYPSSGWPSYTSKSPAGGETVRTGVGDSEANAISLPITTGATAEGEIQTGSSPDVRFKLKFAIPAAEDTVGIRQLDIVLRYTYTS